MALAMMAMHKWLRWAVFGAFSLKAAVALAEPVDEAARAKARSLGYAGVEAYAAGDYVDANAKLDESFRLLSVPSLGLWSARTLVKLGKLVEAEQRYRAVSAIAVSDSDPPAQQNAKVDAAREHAELLSKIPILKVRVIGAASNEIELEIDGAELSGVDLSRALLVNPGRHTVVGTRGSETSEVILTMSEGMHEEISLRFSARPLASPAPMPESPRSVPSEDPTRDVLRTGAWIAIGAGAAGLLTGTVAYLIARDQYDGFEQRGLCAEVGACSPQEVDTYNTLRTLHVVGFIAGGVLSAAGAGTLIALTLTDESAAAEPGVSLRIGPGSAAISGRF